MGTWSPGADGFGMGHVRFGREGLALRRGRQWHAAFNLQRFFGLGRGLQSDCSPCQHISIPSGRLWRTFSVFKQELLRVHLTEKPFSVSRVLVGGFIMKGCTCCGAFGVHFSCFFSAFVLNHTAPSPWPSADMKSQPQSQLENESKHSLLASPINTASPPADNQEQIPCHSPDCSPAS